MDQNYESKRKNLFDCLVDAEKCIQGTTLDQKTDNINLKKRKLSSIISTEAIPEKITEISKFRNKESIFKRPEIPLLKCLKPRVLPDYRKNPHKWTKYSLEDVDTSEKLNSSAAFTFLREMEHKTNEKSLSDNDLEQSDKITFNKPRIFKNTRTGFTDDDDKDPKNLKYKGSKVIMPEYEFGKRMKKQNRALNKKLNSRNANTSLSLSHLCEDEVDSE